MKISREGTNDSVNMASPNTAVTQNAVAVGLEDLRNSEWHIDTRRKVPG